MSHDHQQPPQPGQALNGLLFAVALTVFAYWVARTPGWEIAWLGVIGGGLFVLVMWRNLVAAHRAEDEREEIKRRAGQPGRTYTTGGRWYTSAPALPRRPGLLARLFPRRGGRRAASQQSHQGRPPPHDRDQGWP